MESFLLDENGQFQFDGQNNIVMVSDDDELIQAVRLIITTNKGEWFLNPQMGLDRFTILGQKLSRENIVEKITTAILTGESRVSSVNNIELVFLERKLTINFTFTKKADGTTLTGGATV